MKNERLQHKTNHHYNIFPIEFYVSDEHGSAALFSLDIARNCVVSALSRKNSTFSLKFLGQAIPL